MMTMSAIRLAIEADIPAVLAIANWAALNTTANFAVEPESLESWRDSFRASSEFHPWVVAEGEGIKAPRHQGIAPIDRQDHSVPRSLDALAPSLLGFAKSTPWKGRCSYNWTAETTVYVDPDHQGSGTGKALYRSLIDILRAQGYRTLLGGIAQPNEISVRLHESLGYRKVAMLEQVGYKFERWHDVGYWELTLNDEDGSPDPIRPVAEVAGAVLSG